MGNEPFAVDHAASNVRESFALPPPYEDFLHKLKTGKGEQFKRIPHGNWEKLLPKNEIGLTYLKSNIIVLECFN